MSNEQTLQVIAKSKDEALKKAAEQLNVSNQDLRIVSSRKLKNTTQFTVSRGNGDTLKHVNSVLERIEQELSDIELSEITQSYSEEDLLDRELLGEGKTNSNHGKYSALRRSGSLIFEDGIEFYEAADDETPSTIPFESLPEMADVEPQSLFAHIPFDANTQIPTLSDEYWAMSHVEVKQGSHGVEFFARLPGKIVVWNELPYILTRDHDGHCLVSVSEDKMSAVLRIFPASGAGKPVDESQVTAELEKAGVTYGIQKDEIIQALRSRGEPGEEGKEFVVACGIQPVDGKDAEVELLFQTAPTVGDFAVLPDGRVDYRRNVEIPTARKGDLIARVHEPKPGSDGMTVSGNTVAHTAGERDVLCPGDNVKCQDQEFFAESDGYLGLHGSVIHVFPTHVVEGDVDYHTGNVSFGGNIIIKGDVRAGFEVRARGDITVMKNIDSASVRAGRDLIVYGGIVGNNQIVVGCGRDLYCTYLQNAVVEVEGDVQIHRSAIQSSLSCSGTARLTAGKGAFVGGTMSAGAGMEANFIGSPSGVRTEIIVGQDFLMNKRILEIEKICSSYAANIAKLDRLLMPIVELLRKGMKIDASRMEAFQAALQKRRQLQKNERILQMQIRDLHKKAQLPANARIRVHRNAYPDMMVRIAGGSAKYTGELYGVEFHYSKEKGCIEHTPIGKRASR